MRVGDIGAVGDAGDAVNDPVAHLLRAPADAGGGVEHRRLRLPRQGEQANARQ